MERPAIALLVDVVRFVDWDPQPGIVEARFVDAHGNEWNIIDKWPIFSEELLTETSAYPVRASIPCEVLGWRHLDDGVELVTVTTERPWHVIATGGETIFDVNPLQLTTER